jgi:type III pantothenate kinase
VVRTRLLVGFSINYLLFTIHMLLAVDIGNSAIKFGLFEGEKLSSKFSIPTRRDVTANELWLAAGDRVRSGPDAAIVCSVVSDIDTSMTEYLREVTNSEPTFVNNSFDFGLKINYQPLESLGTDRLVNAYAAVEKYGAPCLVCSLGTATTIDVLSADREFLGGVIAPGMDAMGEALHLKAPRLPQTEILKPQTVIASATEESIRSGIYYGYLAMVEGLLTRLRHESGVSKVIGTGGNAASMSTAGLMTIDTDLTLGGLLLLSR